MEEFFRTGFLKKKKKPRSRYKQVNVWKTHFGPIAVSAIFDIYSQRFNMPLKEAKKLNFTHCVDSLRKLEDDGYIPYSQRK